MNFETIKKNFDRGLWTIGFVKLCVRKGVITVDEFAEITGEAYDR